MVRIRETMEVADEDTDDDLQEGEDQEFEVVEEHQREKGHDESFVDGDIAGEEELLFDFGGSREEENDVEENVEEVESGEDDPFVNGGHEDRSEEVLKSEEIC